MAFGGTYMYMYGESTYQPSTSPRLLLLLFGAELPIFQFNDILAWYHCLEFVVIFVGYVVSILMCQYDLFSFQV